MNLRPFLYVSTLLLSVGPIQAQDWVPFAIPAEPNLRSPIAVTSFVPIEVHSERLQARDGHFWLGDRRVRLWGVNLSFAANFPSHADAVKIAGRMGAAGVNTVRLHHMDTSAWPDGIWDSKEPTKLSAEALDRLDFFIHELAKRGVLVNLNLHVGRAHSRHLGLPAAHTDYDKIVGIFTPALVAAQKGYASDLLNHRNPYRGDVRYADDPAVALVEITNEDSFFMWSGDQDLRSMPAYYAGILQGQFNAWLRQRYSSTPALASAWSKDTQPLGQNILTNSPLAAQAQGWNLEQHDDCKASLLNTTYQGQECLQVKVLAKDNTGWHLQLNQGKVAVGAGAYYTVTFQAAADRARSIGCNVGQAHDPWAGLGLSRGVDLTQGWKTFRLGFVATQADTNARVNLSFGNDATTFYLAHVEMRPDGQVGLAPGEGLDSNSVALFQENEGQARTLDRMVFLAQTEKAYFDGMRTTIRQDLGCKALVTGTIVFGPLGLYAQSDMDFVDSHAYWQHPSWPGRPWDSSNWLIGQIAMTDRPDQATLFDLAAQRLAGKPYTVSEYNHPAPNDYQAECVPMIASYAAAQDWDGVWLYTYSHSNDQWDRQVLNSYFDIDTNPAKWGFIRAGAAILREGRLHAVLASRGVRIAGPNDLPVLLAPLHLRYDRDMLSLLRARAGDVTTQDMLGCIHLPSYVFKPGIKTAFSHTPGTQVAWSVRENGQGLYQAVGSQAQVYTGHAGLLEEATSGAVRILSPDFVAIAMVTLDQDSSGRGTKVLVSACGRCENVGMGFSADRRTVGRNWGRAPVQIEAVTGKVRLPAGDWRCQALGPDGSPHARVPVDPNGPILALSSQYKTMWYLLTRQY
ncbi:MAG: carbohydrate binding domain-containing protein [Phycisphaerae bacterium]|nr:carbohydrate binding domain-containing protein [Phycisphaerae bacterium]